MEDFCESESQYSLSTNKVGSMTWVTLIMPQLFNNCTPDFSLHDINLKSCKRRLKVSCCFSFSFAIPILGA